MGGPGSGRISREEYEKRISDDGIRKLMDDLVEELPDGKINLRWSVVQPSSKLQPKKSAFKYFIERYFANDLTHQQLKKAWVWYSLYLAARLRDRWIRRGYVEEGMMLEHIFAGLVIYSETPSDVWKLYEEVLVLAGSIREKEELEADAAVDPEELAKFLPDPLKLNEIPKPTGPKDPETEVEKVLEEGNNQ